MQQTGHKDRDMIFLRAYSIDEVVMDIQNSRLQSGAYSMQTSEDLRDYLWTDAQ